MDQIFSHIIYLHKNNHIKWKNTDWKCGRFESISHNNKTYHLNKQMNREKNKNIKSNEYFLSFYNIKYVICINKLFPFDFCEILSKSRSFLFNATFIQASILKLKFFSQIQTKNTRRLFERFENIINHTTRKVLHLIWSFGEVSSKANIPPQNIHPSYLNLHIMKKSSETEIDSDAVYKTLNYTHSNFVSFNVSCTLHRSLKISLKFIY